MTRKDLKMPRFASKQSNWAKKGHEMRQNLKESPDPARFPVLVKQSKQIH